MTEPLSWPQICERYPDQWVALVEMDWNDETDEFTTARVAGHGATRGEPFAQMRRVGCAMTTSATSSRAACARTRSAPRAER